MLKHDEAQPGGVGDKSGLLRTAERFKVVPRDSDN